MNFFTDNPDLQFHFREGIPWQGFVPLWEDGFRDPEGPGSLDDARQLYDACLARVGELAAQQLAPRAREIDERGVGFADGEVVLSEPLLRNVEALRELGAMGVTLPRARGGLGFPYTVSAAVVELVGTACTNTLLRFVFYQSPALLVERFGSQAQKERWVPRLAEGEISGCVAMTEADAGSDLGRLATRAEPDGDAWRVTGRKQFITNGGAELCVALVRTDPQSSGLAGLSLALLPRILDGARNYQVAPPERKLVIRGSPTCELFFDRSRAELLGAPGSGFRQILTFMNEARVAVALQGLGISQAALRAARDYAAGRVQMGRPIARHELIADLLLDMEAEVAALRALVYRVTALQDRLVGLEQRGGASARELASLRRAVRDRTPLLKWLGSERTLFVARSAVQVLGGYGVMQDYDVERHYRNAVILPIYEGTSQIQALMSLKDQLGWALQRPWRLLSGPVRVDAPRDRLGDALREMAGEYNRSLRRAAGESLGWEGLLAGVLARRRPDPERLSYLLLVAERLTAMLARIRAGEALAGGAGGSPERRRLAERYVHRSLPLVRMHGEIVRSGDRSTLETIG